MEDKINYETANNEFERFCEEMCIETNTQKMGDEDIEDFEKFKQILINAICKGTLVINDDGEPVYTPQKGDNLSKLTFHEPTGDDLAAQDKRSKGQDCGKFYEVMGSITKTHASRFRKMKNSDLKVCRAITMFFLA